MSSTRRSPPQGTQPRNFPLFLITLPRTTRSQEIFWLTALCHISIGVVAYRAQNGLTQCHNCQQFGHVWANCKQPPRCLWCEAATYTKSAHREKTLPPLQLAATASWRREKSHTQQTVGVAGTRGRSCRGGRLREHPKLQRGGCFPPNSPRQVSPSRLRSEAVQHSSNSNLRHANPQWLILPELRLLGGIKMQVSKSGPLV
jgi:hypothetical protein